MDALERIASLDGASEPDGRSKKIVRTSVLGILANVFLAAFKAAVGILSNSIAIILDAVNNISDAASSLITIIGTKLAGKAPDRKHPYGHGRAEYLSSMIISFLVIYAGVTSLVESVKKIFSPETPDYSPAALVIIAVAVAVKIVLGVYVKSVGKKVNSDSLVNSGEDAKLDAVISFSTLVAAAVFLIFHLSLEAYLGAAISVYIVISGIKMLRETISRILGERVDADLARDIKKTVCSFPDVYGAYDLILNNYGPDAFNGSVHIEVPDTKSANELDELIREITLSVYRKHNVLLTAVGVYSLNTQDEYAVKMREDVREVSLSHEGVLQMHGFFADTEKKTMRFDLVLSFDVKDRRELWKHITDEISEKYPGYTVQITPDYDFSES
ncbi:MAG: cation transporter [Clostridia bacterium]|nr:cation transporter [Clostridia bacterium]